MIRFDDVTKTYLRGTHPALKNLSIEFSRGEFVFLVGASGSGKSTLMRLVLKETNPSRGTVYVAGKDLSRIPSRRVPALRRDIGMVFQDFRLLPSKTAYQNVEFALAVIGTPARTVRRLVPEMLEMVDLADKAKRYPHELSGGEQQRVAIARAYVNRPTILLADEPTGNLDPATSEGILDLLTRINERGTTVVMATHDQGAVDRMRRRVVELVGGRVVRDDDEGLYDAAPAEDHDQQARRAPGADGVGPEDDHDGDHADDVSEDDRAERGDDHDGETDDAWGRSGEEMHRTPRSRRPARGTGGSRAVPVPEDVEEEDLFDERDDREDEVEDAFEDDDAIFVPGTDPGLLRIADDDGTGSAR